MRRGQQRLPEHVVDLVRARVVQVLALEQQPDAEACAEVLALGERRRPAGVVAQQVVELGAERGVAPTRRGTRPRALAGGDESLGDEAPAELAEPSVGVRLAHRAKSSVPSLDSSCQS